jgi:hypothetical protein
LVSVIRTAALVGMVLLPASFAAQAKAQEEEFTEHFYLGGGLAYAIPDFADYNSTNRDAEATFGFDARGGYRWRWVATELDVQYYDKFDLNDEFRSGNGALRGVTAGPNVKFTPFTGRLQPYALGGLGLLYTKDTGETDVEDGTDFMLRAGGGLEVETLPSIWVFAEGSYVFGIGTKHDLIPVIAGLIVRFN